MEQKPPFNVDALLVFSKVVESLSVSRAAQILAMPKSTVSRQITKLEQDLGLKLLRKNTQQLSVTDVGWRVYQHSQKILAEANDIRSLVQGYQQELLGSLRVALPVFLGIDFASRVGARFLARYPKSQLDIRLVDNPAHPVNDGFDLTCAIGPLQDSSLIARKLFSMDCFLCASNEFLKKRAEPLRHPSELASQPFIEPDLYPKPHKLVLRNGRKKYELSPKVRARVNNFQVCKYYLLQDQGIGLMPKQILCTGELQAGSLVPVLPTWQPDPLDVYMLYSHQLSFSNLISAFYDTVVEIIQENSSRL